MIIQDVLLYAEGIIKRASCQMSKEERNALFDMISLIRHEFNPADDVRTLIDNQICRIQWMNNNVEDICGDAGIPLLHEDAVSLICQPGFSKRLKECCESAGTDFIISEAQKFMDLV